MGIWGVTNIERELEEGDWMMRRARFAGLLLAASVSVLAGCKKKASQAKNCDKIARKYAAADPELFMSVCQESPQWAVTCMADDTASKGCLKRAHEDLDGSWRRLNEALAGVRASTPGSDGGAGGGTQPAGGDAGTQTASGGSDREHQLFHAAAATGDIATITAVNHQIGIVNAQGVPSETMEAFMNAHTDWATLNAQWIMDNVADPAKAKAWLETNNK